MKSRQTRETCVIKRTQLSGRDIIRLLHSAGHDGFKSTDRVYITVPTGADWSGMDLEVGSDVVVIVSGKHYDRKKKEVKKVMITKAKFGLVLMRAPSHTKDDVSYEIRLDVNNTVYCTCDGWKHRHECSHLDDFRAFLNARSEVPSLPLRKV